MVVQFKYMQCEPLSKLTERTFSLLGRTLQRISHYFKVKSNENTHFTLSCQRHQSDLVSVRIRILFFPQNRLQSYTTAGRREISS